MERAVIFTAAGHPLEMVRFPAPEPRGAELRVRVICCTLCSCTAFTIIGLPPDWYKDLEYRSRVVRESRTVLKEMGLDLAPDVEIRVWDTTADTRYIVLPEQPPHTIGWPEDKLVDIVTRDALIGVARL